MTFDNPVIKQETEFEAITRPYVVKEGASFHMWFCYRGSHNFRDGTDAYRIGYAYSETLQHWQRTDEEAGIELSASGWDSKMIAYPSVVMFDTRMLMFYNGNSFGAEGFGFATLSRKS
jgi:hypothetical protein